MGGIDRRINLIHPGWGDHSAGVPAIGSLDPEEVPQRMEEKRNPAEWCLKLLPADRSDGSCAPGKARWQSSPPGISG